MFRKSFGEVSSRAKPTPEDDVWISICIVQACSLQSCKICHFRRVRLGRNPSPLWKWKIIITSIEFKPLPAGPEYVVLDRDRDPTIIIHNESLEMENPWAMEFCEVPTLKSEGKDSMDKQGRFILCHTQYRKGNRMHLICAPGSSSAHTIDYTSVYPKQCLNEREYHITLLYDRKS
jgi:hypothetical protein